MADTAVISAAVQGAAVSAQGPPDTTVAVASGFVSVANQLAGVTAGNLTISAAHTRRTASTRSWSTGKKRVHPLITAIAAAERDVDFYERWIPHDQRT